MAAFKRLRPGLWNRALLALCSASLCVCASPVATGLALAAEPDLVTKPQQAPTLTRLTYTSTNAEAGLKARYGLFFPIEARSMQSGSQTWILLFDADLNVQAYKRRLHFCYRTDRAGRLPSHSQCLESIPAEIKVSVGPGEDRVMIATQASPDPQRQLGLWIDLINPTQPGLFSIQLLRQSSPRDGESAETVGVWTVRIEQTSFDSPGSAE